MNLSKDTRGALLMVLAMVGFTINDAAVKTVLPTMNIGQVMLLRGAMTSLLVYLVARQMGALSGISTLLQPMVALRVAFESAAAIAFLTALGNLPLGNISAIMQSLPLAVTLGAAIFLREPVGWRRWTAIVVGFVGVLIILRPGPEGFSAASFWALLAVAFAAGRDICTKRVHVETSSLMVTLFTTAGNAVLGAALVMPYGGWQPVTIDGIGLLALASVMLFVGQQALVIAMRTADISFVAPFRYTGMLWGILLGIAFFGESFDAIMLLGGAIVILSGLYTFYRENKLRLRSPVGQRSQPGSPL